MSVLPSALVSSVPPLIGGGACSARWVGSSNCGEVGENMTPNEVLPPRPAEPQKASLPPGLGKATLPAALGKSGGSAAPGSSLAGIQPRSPHAAATPSAPQSLKLSDIAPPRQFRRPPPAIFSADGRRPYRSARRCAELCQRSCYGQTLDSDRRTRTSK